MKYKKHFIMLAIALFAWIGFYLLGLPSHYFTDWSLEMKFLLSLVTCFAIVPFIATVTLTLLGGNYFKTSIWFAFYASIPLFILDYIAEQVVMGHDGNFFLTCWPQVLGYVYVWIVIPLTGITLKKITDYIQYHARGRYE